MLYFFTETGQTTGGIILNDLQIEYFLTVAENLSFTKTATEKHISQPAISRHIAALEEELGVALFERSYKALKLTEAGRIFVDHFKKQRKDLSLAQQLAQESHKRRSRPLSIGCGWGWSLIEFLPEVAEGLSLTDPDVNILVQCYSFDRLAAALTEEQVDVAINIAGDMPALATFHIRHLANIRRSIVYSEHNPRIAPNPRPQDFRDEVFLVPLENETEQIIDLVKSYCEPYGFTPKVQAVRNNDSVFANVSNSFGVAVVDAWTARVQSVGFSRVDLDSGHDIVIAWRRDNENDALPRFLEEMERVFYPEAPGALLGRKS